MARRFPVRVGRSAQVEYQTDEDGVWDEHLSIEFTQAEGFLLQPHPEALVCLNGEAVQRTALRNGDLIELGGLKLQFWLAPAPMGASAWREVVVWAGLAAVAAVQIALICWLPK
ncbi:MAG: FHA domain-containing protein [Limisphaerales bacterium]